MSDEIQRALGRIEGKLDEITTLQKTSTYRLNDHSRRIGMLERWQSKLLGAFAVVSLLIAAALRLAFKG